MTCDQCGRKVGLLESPYSDQETGKNYCYRCAEEIRSKQRSDLLAKRKKEEERTAKLREQAAKVIVTTTPHVDGCVAVGYLGVESVEYVIGTGLFSEIASEVSDFFGARSKGFEKKLAQAKENAFLVLKMRAAEKGANAVVGVDLDYTEFSGNRVALIVNGTLVRLERMPKPASTS